jgi:hypothetical protein
MLAVANTGPAVPPEAIGWLFQPFRRLDGRRVRHDDGHGLGLSIVHAIAAAHGAAITAGARRGGGLSSRSRSPRYRMSRRRPLRRLRRPARPNGSQANNAREVSTPGSRLADAVGLLAYPAYAPLSPRV